MPAKRILCAVISAAVLVVFLAADLHSIGVGISTEPDAVDPEEAENHGIHFFQYRPQGPRANRDLEFQFDSLYVYETTGLSFLSTAFQLTLDAFGSSIAEEIQNPFDANYSDLHLIHDYFHGENLRYDPSPAAWPGLLFGRSNVPDSERAHVDTYIYRLNAGGGGGGSQPSTYIDPREDNSTGGHRISTNSLMLGGPADSVVIDSTGIRWAKPDTRENWVFNHEFQHGLSGQPSVNFLWEYWSTELFSSGAETLGGVAPGEPTLVDVPYTWSLLAERRCPDEGCSPDLCDYPAQIGQNYANRRLFISYLMYNFRGADTTAYLPVSASSDSGFADDLVWHWAHTGEDGRLLINLQNLLSDDDSCSTCDDLNYFHPGGSPLSEYERFQLLHHNWRVANYVNNPELAEGQYGYPPQFEMSPWELFGAWDTPSTQGGCPAVEMVAIPPKLTIGATASIRSRLLAGTRYSDDGQYPYPMVLQPLGSEYWVLRSDSLALSGTQQDLVVRVAPRGIVRDLCTTTPRDGRLVTSVIGYEEQYDSLFKHPEWAHLVDDPPRWVDVDSTAGELEFVVPSFGDTNRAAVVVLSLGDGPSTGYVRSKGLGHPVREVHALPYEVTASIAKAPYPAPFTSSRGIAVPIVADSGDDDDHPTWSPDGTFIASQSKMGETFQQIWVHALDSAGLGILNYSAGDQYQPDWSPRGDWIVFAQDSGSAERHLKLENPSSPNLRKLTFGADHARWPVFRPDGQVIAFVSQARTGAPSYGGWTIKKMAVEGTGLTTLVQTSPGASAEEGELRSLRWNATGDSLYFTRNDSLYRISSSGGTPDYVAGAVGGAKVGSIDFPLGSNPAVFEEIGQFDPSASFVGSNCSGTAFRRIALRHNNLGLAQGQFYKTSVEFRHPRWSPDGTRIAYVSEQNGAGDRDVYVGRPTYNHPPAFSTTPADQELTTSTSTFSIDFAASDPDGDTLSYQIVLPPTGAYLDGSVFRWNTTPKTAGTHHVVLRAKDNAGGVANKVVKLTVRPTAVSNLSTYMGKTTALLNWTEPNQGSVPGDKYDIRRSTSPITDGNFYSATLLDSSLSPGSGPTSHCFEVSGLSSCTTYYFAIKTKAAGLWSVSSNSPTGTTKCTGFDVFCTEGFMAGGGGGESAPSDLGTTSASGSFGTASTDAWQTSLLWGASGAPVTDMRSLGTTVSPSDGAYRLSIWNAGGRQVDLDEFSVAVLDHDPALTAVAGEDSVFVGLPGSVAGAVDDRGNSVAGLTESVDYGVGSEIVIQMNESGSPSALVVEVSSAPGYIDSLGVSVQAQAGDSSWSTAGVIHPGRSPSSHALRTRGGGRVKLVFERDCTLHSIGQLAISQAAIPHRLQLSEADHTRLDDVSEALSDLGGGSVALLPGEEVNLAFTATEGSQGSARSVFLIARGSLSAMETESAAELETAGSSEAVVVGQTWQFALGSARPNPGGGSVQIDYTLARDSDVAIRVYDVAGRLVRTLVNGSQSAGPHVTTWDARSDAGVRVSHGVYFYLMRADEWQSRKKVVLLDR